MAQGAVLLQLDALIKTSSYKMDSCCSLARLHQGFKLVSKNWCLGAMVKEDTGQAFLLVWPLTDYDLEKIICASFSSSVKGVGKEGH
jgi:hypothetical protein